MGMDLYFDRKISKDDFEEVAYWRRSEHILQFVGEVVGTPVENDDHEPLNMKQMLAIQGKLLEALEFEDEIDDDLAERYEYDMKQIGRCLLFLSREEFVWFNPSW